jgi:hypothetical protein
MAKPPEIIPLKIRPTSDLKRRIEREADKRGLSANSEIIRRLEESLAPDPLGGPDTILLLRLISAQVELAKEATSKYAPDDVRALEATTRVLAAIAHHLLPACHWVGIGMSAGPDQPPWYKASTRSATAFPSMFKTEE